MFNHVRRKDPVERCTRRCRLANAEYAAIGLYQDVIRVDDVIKT